MHDADNAQRDRLTPADSDALDALVEAGFDIDNVAPLQRARAERVGAVLDLLEPRGVSDAGRRALLIDVTMARVVRTAAKAQPDAADAPLTRDDARVIDALASGGWDAARAPSSLRGRATKWLALLGVIEQSSTNIPIDSRAKASLIDATLGRVQHEIDRAAAARRIAIEPSYDERFRVGFRLRDLVSVAAMGLIAFGVFLPMANAFRQQARLQACESTLANAGVGFAMYANDNHGRMPTAAAGFGAAPWWNVGRPGQSHSANLFTLVRNGYATMDDLACPGNAEAPRGVDPTGMTDWASPAHVSYSYQLPPHESIGWDSPIRVVVLADKSPIIDRARRGEVFDPEARSLNHRGAGQQLLLNDGSVVFIVRPVVRYGVYEDNIWLPRSMENAQTRRITLHGTERPDAQDDAFVAP